ncbi:MAG TPA: DNA polymerase III subunit gamma/tau [Polyangia bacterium]|nr:DNA polymerase III subunit gamma/tau [Polyangia bacterium]
MSYLVLARKFRPQSFEEIIGQEHVTRTLGNAIASGRVHHAFLFCGARGVGKTTAARILAKCLSCERAPTPTPCNQCDACREITAGTSVDVQEIDGASNNSVDDVRTLRESIRYLPVRGKRKVYIIDEVHMLSTGAFNALLKTLEEPPPHALFIFATTEVHKVPITILSRVQRYDFRLVPAARIAAHLTEVLEREQIAFEPGALMLVAREAAGSVRDSLSLTEQVLAVAAGQPLTETLAAEALGVADRGLIVQLGQAVLARDAAQALALVDGACARAYDVQHLAHALLEHLRNLVVARVVQDPAALIDAPTAELAALAKTAQATQAGLLEMLFDRLAKIAQEMTESMLPRYVFEVGLVELCRVEPLEPVAQLVDRLERLETRLMAGGAPEPGRPSGAFPGPSSSRAEQPRASRPAMESRPPAEPRPPVAEPRSPMAEPRSAPAEPRAAASPMTATAPPPMAEPRAAAEPKGPRAAPVADKPAAPAVRPKDWPSLAEAIFQRKPPLAVLLHGEPVAYAPPEIVVAFKSGDIDQVRGRLPDIKALASELLGCDVRLEVREGAGEAPSAMDLAEQTARAAVEKRRQEAMSHPARKLVAEAFGSEVVFKEPEVE